MVEAGDAGFREGSEAVLVGGGFVVYERFEDRGVGHETATRAVAGAVEDEDCAIGKEDPVLLVVRVSISVQLARDQCLGGNPICLPTSSVVH